MKALRTGMDHNEHHAKCVCQICSCSQHRCPAPEVHIPMDELSSYQHEFIAHPLNTWAKPPSQKAQPVRPYGDIASSYRDSYPGHKPQMREKLVPKVKQENANTPFDGATEYNKNFGPKNAERPVQKNKDKYFNPDKQPFEGLSTYKADFLKKQRNPHEIAQKSEATFPEGYGFDGSTTYGKDFTEKPIQPVKSYKPVQKVSDKGEHDLNSIYRQDYQEKEAPHVCPIVKMPKRPHKMEEHKNHLVYNKHNKGWVAQ